MSSSSSAKRSLALSLIAAALFPVSLKLSVAQQPDSPAPALSPRPLITQPIDESQRTILTGNTHPLAHPQFDFGAAPVSLPLQRMLLVLKRSPGQESALQQLLDDQQNKTSPRYHQWLAPEQFGQQFGPTDADIQTITAWLQSHGFQVGTTKGRTVLEFSGTVAQVQEAFHTSLHQYIVNGEQHWANATDPSIPTALATAVAGVASLNNFPRQSMNRFVGRFSRKKGAAQQPVTPLFTFNPGYQCSADDYCFAIGPYDFATIYNVLPLWNASINGTGQTIAIVGESNINPQDIANFRNLFDLPAQTAANGNPLNIILNGPDPGIQGDESEAVIDVSWSGAVAPYATIDFVVSETTETTFGTDLSAVYIVENNLAPVMSESYGSCELGLGTSGNQFYNSLWQQAAAQGITVFISAGDNGSAGCDNFTAQPPSPAQFGLAVSGYASTPYNVAVGGTDFNEVMDPEKYWSITNNSTTQASALGYIPETTWNDSCTNAIFGSLGFSTNAVTNCNNSQLAQFVIPEGGSGGASSCTTPTGSTPETCLGGYAKPSWQTGTGVPADGKRDLPDVSLFASNGFAGTFYVICQSDQPNGSCSSNSPDQDFLGFGGTSVSSPAFAGIMALVNQQTGSRQGNANYVLYKLAATQSDASCNATANPISSCIFNDVTSGTNAMPCASGSPDCTASAGDQYGILTGYNAGTGYDQATGLGSVNANNLVTQWDTVTRLPSATTLSTLTPTTITHGQSVNFTVSVKPESGTGTPTGEISLLGGSSGNLAASAGFNLSNGTVSGTTAMLPGGMYTVSAHYPGDATYAASESGGITVTVNKENSTPQIFLVTFNSNGTLLNSDTTTAPYGSPYLLRVNVENSAGQLCNPVNATASAETACPTGTLTMTNNGASLDAGTYTLNSGGYFEDDIVQLPGGTNSVKAAYSGDNSFNASSTTQAVSITPAATTVSAPTFFSTVSAGQPATISVNVNTTSSGVAPTGTVTFYANGNALGGTASYTPIAGGATAYASLGATLTTNANAFPTPGTYNVTATYNGDANYGSSTSSATIITITYPTPTMTLTPVSQTVSYGGTANVTALVDTSNKSTYPTGTVTFIDASSNKTLAGPTPCSNTADSNGNFACQVAAAFTVTSSHVVFSKYSGDANYPAAISFNVNVNVPGFTIFTGNAVEITAGQSQNVTLTISSAYGFAGTVSGFACSGLPAETTCTFSPTQVTLPANGTANVTITVSTAALGQSVRAAGNRSGIGRTTPPLGLLLGACLIAAPLRRRRKRIPGALLLAAVMASALSCGSSGGGGGGTPNPVPSISSLNPSAVAAGSQVENLYINGSNFLSSSTVSYNGTVRNSALMSPTQLQIGLGPSDVATIGQYPVVVTNPSPGGGPSNSVNLSVESGTPTGNFSATVTATSAPITSTTSLTIIVQ